VPDGVAFVVAAAVVAVVVVVVGGVCDTCLWLLLAI